MAPRFSGVAEGAHLNAPATVGFHNLEDPFGPSFVCALDPDLSGGAVTLPRCTSSMEVGGASMAQGPHAINLKTADRAGNWSPTAILNFVWDTVAPSRELTRTGRANGPKPGYAFTITDAHSAPATVTCRRKGKGVEREEPCAATGWTSAEELTDGLYTLSVVAKDKAGNEATTSELFTVDRTAPGAATDLVWDAAARKVTFDVPAGAEQVTCSVDGGPEQACASPFDASGFAPGDHALVVTVRDWAGNEAKASRAFSIPAPPTPQAQQAGGGTTPAAAKKRTCFRTKKVKGKKKRVKVACKKAPAEKRAAKRRAAKKRR